MFSIWQVEQVFPHPVYSDLQDGFFCQKDEPCKKKAKDPCKKQDSCRDNSDQDECGGNSCPSKGRRCSANADMKIVQINNPTAQRKCLLSSCGKKVAKCKFQEHVCTCHPNCKILNEDTSFHICTDSPKRRTVLIIAHSELFWFHVYNDKSKQTIFAVVQCLENKCEADKYTYTIKMDSCTVQLCFSQTTIPCDEDFNEVLSGGNCFSVPYCLVQSFSQGKQYRNGRLVICKREEDSY